METLCKKHFKQKMAEWEPRCVAAYIDDENCERCKQEEEEQNGQA